jgi:hypothetical protein
MRRRIHVCHMRRRIHVCHMTRRIHVSYEEEQGDNEHRVLVVSRTKLRQGEK